MMDANVEALGDGAFVDGEEVDLGLRDRYPGLNLDPPTSTATLRVIVKPSFFYENHLP